MEIQMTDEQKQKALALGRCTFPVGSGQKRFANNMLSKARSSVETELTEKQVSYLDLLFHQYRRQIKGEHTRLCGCKEAKAVRMQIGMAITK